jgi:hypothetical protein
VKTIVVAVTVKAEDDKFLAKELIYDALMGGPEPIVVNDHGSVGERVEWAGPQKRITQRYVAAPLEDVDAFAKQEYGANTMVISL